MKLSLIAAVLGFAGAQPLVGRSQPEPATTEGPVQIAKDDASKEAAAESYAYSVLDKLKSIDPKTLVDEAVQHSGLEGLLQGTDTSIERAEASWQKKVEALEDYLVNPPTSVLRFNATKAVTLQTNVEDAKGEVKDLIKSVSKKLKDAKHSAKKSVKDKVKELSKEAKKAARAWKKAGKVTVKAQKKADMSENVYERHEDKLEDSVEELKDNVENIGENTEEKTSKQFQLISEKVHDKIKKLESGSENLKDRTNDAVRKLKELVAYLGVKQAYKEALKLAEFKKTEEKYVKEERARGPEAEESRFRGARTSRTVSLAAEESGTSFYSFSTFAAAACFVLVAVGAIVASGRTDSMRSPPLLA